MSPLPSVKRQEKPKRSAGAIFTTTLNRGAEDGSSCLLTFAQEHHKRLGSTMVQARKRATQGRAEGLVVTCSQQTQGRGRFGRTWQSPVGNLYGTLLLRPDVRVDVAPQVGFIASLALAEGLDHCGKNEASEQVLIKWPNDLLTHKGKVAGLLLEAIAKKKEAASVEGLLVGFGVNLVEAPKAQGGAVFGAGIAPQDLLTAFLQGFAEHYKTWQDHGFASIREAWLKRTCRLGEPLVARLADKKLSGLFRGIDESGHLLLELEQADGKVHQETIAAADVWWSPMELAGVEGV